MMACALLQRVAVCLLVTIPWVAPVAAQQSLEAGSWFAACDNLGACRAFGFAPAEDESLPWIGGEGESVLELAIDEHGARSLRIDAYAAAPPDRTWRIFIDDEPLIVVPSRAKYCPEDDTPGLCEAVVLRHAPEVDRLLLGLRRGQRMLTLTADGAPIAQIALEGAAEVLGWLDSMAPVQSARSPRAERGGGWLPLPEEELATWLAQARVRPEAGECETPEDEARSLPGEGFRHADGTVLILFDCFSGPYNAVSLGFVVAPETASLQPLRRTWPEALAAEQGDESLRLANANFDPERGELTIFAKSRGIGDCGTVAGWRYRDGSFHLSELRKMTFCRGLLPDRWPYLWRDDGPPG